MKARDVMTSSVITVSPETHIKDVAAILAQRGVNAVPVIDAGGSLIGIISEHDLLPFEMIPPPGSHLIPLPSNPQGKLKTAADVMTTRVVTLPPDAEISATAWIMVDRRIRQIPIVSEGRVVGIVARRDLLRVLMRSDDDLQSEVQHVLDAEQATIGRFEAEIAGGHVRLRGSADRSDRRLAEILVRRVPGVLSVAFDEEPAAARRR